jgi:trans-aconitate 2-methyltransferase
MIASARKLDTAVEFEVGDVRQWVSASSTTGGGGSTSSTDVPGSVDVLVSNATLQWIPGHLDLLPGLVDAVAPGGWLAFQVPGNFDQPSHTIRAELAAEAPYAEHTAGVATPGAHDAATYLAALSALGCTVDAWETTYLHVLHGEDPVFTWVSGTGARPTLQALEAADPELRARFEAEFRRRLRAAYPQEAGRVVLPFRRVFAVARKAVRG